MIARRREFLRMAISTALIAPLGRIACAQRPGFEELFKQIQDDDALLSAGRDLREREVFEYENFAAKGIAPRTKVPPKRGISPDAFELIVRFEVTNRAAYEKKYRGAIWPKGQSGITIGIGYDVGYVTKSWLHEDWDGIASAEGLKLLEPACEVTGEPASKLLSAFSIIDIPYDKALEQFSGRTLPGYISQTLGALPNTGQLSDDCLGALVSLVYNRGASFKNTTDRYREMRSIRLHMVKEQFELIPQEFRSMIRLWEGVDSMRGLVTRRELEARLFERGLMTKQKNAK